MINIVKDLSKTYISTKEHIVVKDMKSYFKARKKFFQAIKDKVELEIIIKNKIYFPYFLDLEEYNINIENMKEIEDPIIDLGSSNNILEILLLGKNISTDEDIIIETLRKIYFKDYSFLMDLDKIDDCIYELIKGIIFSTYREHNFNLLMGNKYIDKYLDFKNNIELQKNYKELEVELASYIFKCNKELEDNKKKIAIFNEMPDTSYLKEVSGKLAIEKDFYIYRTLERLNVIKNYEEILRSIEAGEVKFNTEFKDIKELLKKLLNLSKENRFEKNNIDEWKEYFNNYYIKHNNLSEVNDIVKKIACIEKKYKINLNSLKMSNENNWKKINRDFGNFLFNNYEELYSSNKKNGLDYIISKNYNRLNTKKNLFIFIDCLRFDIWKGVKKIILEQGYNCQKEEIILSAIPTVTSYCKKILYSGKKYNQIENSYDISALKDLSLSREVIKVSNFDNINELTENVFLYEILDLDHLFHNIKDLTEEYLLQNIDFKLKKIFESIDKDKFNLIIMTDHGATKLLENGLSILEEKNYIIEQNLKIENHGRYIKIYGSNYDENIYNTLKKSLEKREEFYSIDREKMNNFYLSPVERDKENYFFLIYKYGKYPKNTGEFNHGGLSLEEILIPFGIFSTDKKEYIPVDLEVKTKEVENKNNSELEILLKNQNILNNLKVKLKYQEKEQNFKKLEGSKILQFSLNLNNEMIGEFTEILEILFDIDGKEYKIEKVLKIQIKKNKIEELNKKLKKSRELL